MNIQAAINQVVQRQNLSEDDMCQVMNEIMTGGATPAQIGSFLTALRMKGETVDEITGAVRVMREKATIVKTGVDTGKGDILMDNCGTGGDGSGTFNVSTTSAFVVAGGNIPVAKHGNRSITSNCGSADVLEAAGISLDLSAEAIGKCVQEVGIGFLFAPALHGAMKHAIGPRKEIAIRTIFNVLGPLTNPAGANVQVIGVFSGELTEPLAMVLAKLGTRRALVVHGEGNLDELTVTGKTQISELKDNEVKTYTITPEDAGLTVSSLESLRGGRDAIEACQQMKDVLAGAAGPKRDMVLLNSGAAFLAADVVKDLKEGVAMAAEVIDSGRATKKLDDLVQLSKQLKESS